MKPTTQLVEAIERAVNSSQCPYGEPHMPCQEHSRAQHVRLAIADAVDGWIGEDIQVSTLSAHEWTNTQGVQGINAEKARMRTFTAALREAAK